MAVSNVSFGRIAFVFGSPNSVKRFDEALRRRTQVRQEYLTNYYRDGVMSGINSRLAKNGQSVKVYLTGSDAEKAARNEADWDTIEGILSQRPISVFLDNKKQYASPEEAAAKVAAHDTIEPEEIYD